MKTFFYHPLRYWSNCLVEALRAKHESPDDVKLICIFSWLHFHAMWYDRRTKTVCHFTHKFFDGFHCDLWFNGCIEEKSVESFNAYCKKIKKEHLMIEENDNEH